MTVTTDAADGILTITLDDGAKNALDVPTMDALIAAFDGAGPDDKAIVLTGRDDILSAGLNVKVLMTGPEAATGLVVALGRLIMRIWTEPRPVVTAAHGHAIAGGTMLCMAADHSVMAEVDAKIGLTETQVGLPLPWFVIELARQTLRNDVLQDLILKGRVVGPAEAVDVGFVTEVAPHDQVLSRARDVATSLTSISELAWAETKRRFRQETADRVLAGLDDDAAELIAAALG